MYSVWFHLTNGATAPTRGTAQAAGWDLFPLVSTTIKPGTRVLVDTGVKVMIPSNCYAQIHPRSGLAVKQGIDIGAGVIDSDYRGTIKVCIINNGNQNFITCPAVACAQLIIHPLGPSLVEIKSEVDFTNASEYITQRNESGFGSTTTSNIPIPTTSQTAVVALTSDMQMTRQQWERHIKRCEQDRTPISCFHSLNRTEPCKWCDPTTKVHHSIPSSPPFPTTGSARPLSATPINPAEESSLYCEEEFGVDLV